MLLVAVFDAFVGVDARCFDRVLLRVLSFEFETFGVELLDLLTLLDSVVFALALAASTFLFALALFIAFFFCDSLKGVLRLFEPI